MGIRASVTNVVRIEQVVTAFLNHGLQVPLGRLRLTHCASWSCRAHCTIQRWMGRIPPETEWGVAVRETLIELGPAFVKLGQILSVRSDLVPAPLVEALRTLQSSVPPFSYEEVRERIQEETGAPVEAMFRRFTEEPLAAASIGQVHEAELLDGTRVAVKIKRPGIDEVVERDMDVLVWLADHAEKYSEAATRYRPGASARELREYTLRELDFRHESHVARRMAEHFADRPGVRVPTVYESTRGLLVMEFIDGVQIDDVEGMERMGVDRSALTHTALDAVLAQIFEFGLFHGDPHPGNLHVTAEGDLVFLDFGIFGELDERTQRLTALLMNAMVGGEIDRATGYLLRMARLRPDADPDAFRDAVGACYRRWQGSTVSEYGFAELIYDELSLGAQNGVIFPADMVLFGKAMLTIEGVILALDPELDLSKEAAPYMEALGKRMFSKERLEEACRRSAPLWWELAEALPTAIPMALDRLLEPSKSPRIPALAPVVQVPLAEVGMMVTGAMLMVSGVGPLVSGVSVLGLVVLGIGVAWSMLSRVRGP